MIRKVRLLIWLFLLLPSAPLLAADDNVELKIKAAFLYKFCQYIDWPDGTFASETAPLTIAVLGASELSRELQEAVVGRQIVGREIRILELRPEDDLKDVQVLFIGRGSQAINAALRDAQHAILTVSESTERDDTGIINFVIVDNRVRFDIAQDLASRAGLKLSSQLLSVARRVHTEASP